MKTLAIILFFLLLAALVFWARVYPFREKKSKAPERTARARLIAKDVTTGADRTGRSTGMGYNYRLTFRLDSGEEVALYAHDTEWGSLQEGTEGLLCWQERYFVHFKEG